MISISPAEESRAPTPPIPHRSRRVGYGGTLCPLLGLQFVALAWVALNQFRNHLGLHLGDRSGLVAKGYLGAALFFVATGFLLSHLVVRAARLHRFSYRNLLWRTWIRIYPLHLAATAVMVALVLAGRLGKVPITTPGVFNAPDLIPHLLLLQAWGTLPTDTWNFPSWLASALWFGVLAFPVTAWIALKPGRPGFALICAALVLFWVMFMMAGARHLLFTDFTAKMGALQTVPAFLLGAAFYQVGLNHELSPRTAAVLAGVSAAWIAIAASVRFSDMIIWPAFGPLVFGLAKTKKTARPFPDRKLIAYLGQITLGMFLFYLPVDIIYFHTLRLVFGETTGTMAWLELLGVFPIILLAGVIAHHAIENPARSALNRLCRNRPRSIVRQPFQGA